MRSNIMREQVIRSLRDGAELRLELADRHTDDIIRTARALARCFQRGGKLLIFGNGGSAADAQHIAAEFVGRFSSDRHELPAIALTTDTSILTAIGNDFGFEHVFARQVQAIGKTGDFALAITTSGRSPNVLAGVKTAKQKGLVTVGLVGGGGGRLAGMVDIAIVVPSSNTARVQECHIAIGHILCEAVESMLSRSRRRGEFKKTHRDRSTRVPSAKR